MNQKKYKEALFYAFKLHEKQKRKGTSIPYFFHLVSVSSLVIENGGNTDEAIAGLLHDAVEDQGGTKTLIYIKKKFGNKVARSEIAQIKVHVPIVACRLIDRAIQMHGGGGVSQDFPLASMYAHMRTLRLADGPDEVHRRVIAREEYSKYADQAEETIVTRD